MSERWAPCLQSICSAQSEVEPRNFYFKQVLSSEILSLSLPKSPIQGHVARTGNQTPTYNSSCIQHTRRKLLLFRHSSTLSCDHRQMSLSKGHPLPCCGSQLTVVFLSLFESQHYEVSLRSCKPPAIYLIFS